MPEKKEKKPEKQTAYIGLTILFFLFIAVVMVLVKFRLVQPVNLYVVSEPSDSLQTASEPASSSAEEVMAGAVKDILREALDIREESHASNLQEPESQGASAEKKINNQYGEPVRAGNAAWHRPKIGGTYRSVPGGAGRLFRN